jgi:hypothetical protein
MNVFEIYQLVNFWSNKEQTGRTYTPEQFNLGLKAIDIDFLKLKYGLPEDYRPGMPMPRQAWAVTQKIVDDLRHLKTIMGGKDTPLLKVDVNGYAQLPSDYIHFSSLRIDRTDKECCEDEAEETSTPVEVLTDMDFDARLWSEIKKPWIKYPFCRFNGSHIEFRPKNVRFAIFSYIAMPKPGFLAFTISGDNDIVYDPINSIQIGWPADMHTDIANRLYLWLQGNLQSQLGIQLAKARQDNGQ